MDISYDHDKSERPKMSTHHSTHHMISSSSKTLAVRLLYTGTFCVGKFWQTIQVKVIGEENFGK